MGTTRANFESLGTFPDVMDKLNSLEMLGVCNGISSISAEMPSAPVDLFVPSVVIEFLLSRGGPQEGPIY